MEGYRTIIVNAIALLASVAALFGLGIGLEVQSAVVMAVMSIGGIVMRMITKTPAGKQVKS